jgi:hypothetical protein
MRLFELVIEDEMTDEVFQISLVENPAIEAFGVFFNKEEVHFAEMEEEGLFMAPILIPEKKILRVDGEGNSYQVYFTAATIKRLSQMYLEKKYQANINVEHKDKVNGVTLVESWIKESAERDKSKLYGLNVPVGSWIGTFKIDNEEVKEKFRNGELKAVSIEGLFEHLEKTKPEELQAAMIMDMWNKHINELSEVEAELMLSVIGDMIELESFTDYGDGIRNNAKRGIELNEKNGNRCATQVGKLRAQQLAQNKPISLETIKRMYSFLSRAETYYDEGDTTACGTISYLLWGGKSALSWSRNKLRELGALQENEAQPSVASTYPGQAASGSVAPALLAEAPNLDVYGYETKYFQICPGAQKTFTEIVSLPNDEEYIGMVRSAAVVADAIFKIENDVLEAKKATPQQLKEAILLVEDYKDIIHEIDEEHGMISDVSYMDGHIKTIESFL